MSLVEELAKTILHWSIRSEGRNRRVCARGRSSLPDGEEPLESGQPVPQNGSVRSVESTVWSRVMTVRRLPYFLQFLEICRTQILPQRCPFGFTQASEVLCELNERGFGCRLFVYFLKVPPLVNSRISAVVLVPSFLAVWRRFV